MCFARRGPSTAGGSTGTSVPTSLTPRRRRCGISFDGWSPNPADSGSHRTRRRRSSPRHPTDPQSVLRRMGGRDQPRALRAGARARRIRSFGRLDTERPLRRRGPRRQRLAQGVAARVRGAPASSLRPMRRDHPGAPRGFREAGLPDRGPGADERPCFVEELCPDCLMRPRDGHPFTERAATRREHESCARADEFGSTDRRQLDDEVVGAPIERGEERPVRTQSREPHHRPAAHAGVSEEAFGQTLVQLTAVVPMLQIHLPSRRSVNAARTDCCWGTCPGGRSAIPRATKRATRSPPGPAPCQP